MALSAKQPVGIERFVCGRGPFGTRGRAAFAALVHRQLQGLDQRLDLVARGEMRRIRARPECALLDVVEGSKPAGKIFAIDHPLGEAVDRAESELAGKGVE